ncbi:hypothetical protein [Luteolibacter sp. LG18]|uniref:hypothetical protein n=1 Tax=Luteolibacter sp. LG18 TaxID=2819286 RepID=UPI002B2A2CD8|nr:hypothetical protein llg_37480 [Luteolibacter sp. LG18]
MEIVMVLAIAALVIGGAVGLMVYHTSERELRRVSGEVEIMAKRARMIALLQQKPYAIVFVPGKVLLMPLAEMSGTEQNVSRSLGSQRSSHSAESPTDEEVSPSAAAQAPVHDEIALDGEFSMMVRHWGADKWVPMDERRPEVWRFDPEGLCEPISVRLTYKDGWIEDEYHPLTASIRDSATEFK